VKQTSFNDLMFWNGNRTPGSFFEGVSNQPISVLDRWQRPGDDAEVAKFSSSNNFLSYILSSDHRYTDASYIRLKNVSLSWELPATWINKTHFKKCRIYVHGQNLLTVTKYKGDRFSDIKRSFAYGPWYRNINLEIDQISVSQ
jgi:hypothetical protein